MKRLYKSRKNRKIGGVCGGIAEYFEIDVTIVRLVFVVVTLIWGFGLLAYIIAAIIMPESREVAYSDIREDDINNMKSANINPENDGKQGTKKAPHSDSEFDEFFSK